MSLTLAYSITQEEMEENYNTLLAKIEQFFPSRSESILKMYDDLGDEVILAPGSSIEHYHNAFPGGYVEHVLRVLKFSFSVYELWLSTGMDLDFTPEELAFVAIHHDLGKVGLPGENLGRYIWNHSDWHRKNQGKIYDTNPDLPFMPVQDMSLFLLQKYNIPLTLNETLGIKLHDGLYDDSNKHYYLARQHKSSLRTYLPYIVHHADLMASKFEYQRWAQLSGKGLKKYKQNGQGISK